MKITPLFLVCWFFCFWSDAQSIKFSGQDYASFQLKTHNRVIHYYVTKSELNVKKPVFIYLTGSGPDPLFTIMPSGFSTTIFLGPDIIGSNFHHVVISKPGVPFEGKPDEFDHVEYFKHNELHYLAENVSYVIDHLVKQPWVDKTKIILVGHSEGANVAAKVARINKHVTHIAYLSGGGLTQMYEFVIDVRKKVQQGKISPAEGEVQISELYKRFDDIEKDPLSITKMWRGHSYLRWSSFFNNPPVNNLLKLKIPVFVAVGSSDTNSPIESSDIIPIEFIKNKKTNLTYKVWSGADHGYQELQIDSSGHARKISFKKELVKAILEWIKSN